MRPMWSEALNRMGFGRPLAGVLAAWMAAAAPAILSAAPAGGSLAVQDSLAARMKRASAIVMGGGGNLDVAVRELKEILAIDPKLAEAHLLLGVAYRLKGDRDLVGEAKAELRQSLALKPDLVPARFFLAELYLDLGRPRQAREQLRAGLAQVPGQPQLLALLGETERRQGDPRGALDVLRPIVQADAAFGQARYYLALALFDLGERDAAIRELETVARSNVAVADVYASLGAAYLEAGRLDEAVAVLEQGLQLRPQPEMRVPLARGYRLQGRLEQAEEQLDLAAAQAPASQFSAQHSQEVAFFLERGQLALARKRLGVAAEAFRRLLESDPQHGPGNRHLAEVYLLQGRFAEAAELAGRAERAGSPLSEDRRRQLEEQYPAGKRR